MNSKVFLALSGGVDSSVSAALLKEQGYDVTGVFMKNWSGDDFGIQADCPWEEDQKDAESVCKTLGIEFRSVNFEKEYRDKVVKYFFDEYQKGRTPNPDIMCNKEIKFKLFLEKSIELGFDHIATGHYARVTETIESDQKVFHLLKGLDTNKDQTYFIHNLTQKELSRTLFPIGHLVKPEVRELAKKFKLPNADKPDSQGICFIGEINVLKFLMANIPEKVGIIKDIDTDKIVGEHRGIYFYTIGQREGLGIGGQATPYFVVGKNIEENILYVGHGGDHPALLSKSVNLESIQFTNEHINSIFEKEKLTGLGFEASIRYRHKPEPGVLKSIGDQIAFEFQEPQRSIASGQSLVIYRGEECFGGGVIK